MQPGMAVGHGGSLRVGEHQRGGPRAAHSGRPRVDHVVHHDRGATARAIRPASPRPLHRDRVPLSHEVLASVYTSTPGLISDKIKATLEFAWHHLRQQGQHEVIFAYDEAQNLADHAEKEQFPLSVLLDVFQSIQKKGIPFMLGPRRRCRRCFRSVVDCTDLRGAHVPSCDARISSTSDKSREAILKLIEVAECPIKFHAGARWTRYVTSRAAIPISSGSFVVRSSTFSSSSTRQ